MTTMDDEGTMDEPMDEPLRDLAATGYNTPDGRVPREEMWANIAAARRAARVAPTSRVDETTHAGTPVIPLHRRPRTIRRWAAALAAGLVLGVAVDRVFTIAPPPSSVAAIPDRVAPPTRNDARIDPMRERPGTESPTDPNDMYRAAAVQTLIRAEALLTAYRSGDAAPDPLAVQQAARWARDVLSSTRLLMDSPAARDPQMRVLFSDLELVLAQIVQLSGAPLQAPERELIDRALRDRDLLPRLRSAVPAGLATS
ncbi:MAG: hypothetical protein ABIP93_01360 [Gemmatimonadaceae bacterium]